MLLVAGLFSSLAANALAEPGAAVTLNRPDDGYRGVWYMNQPTGDAHRYKYSGGLGTYCDYHQPLAVYDAEANKTFFCYGGAAADSNERLWHMVSYFDHASGLVPRPTILLDKQTGDAHDNPVLAIDGAGHIWIFSSSHGLGRPSYIHRSRRPRDVGEFELIEATRRDGERDVPLDNFSYPQFWYDRQRGFVSFFTRYGYPAARTSCLMTSPDGVRWSEWRRLAAIGEGHYQISAVGPTKAAAMMNYHPAGKGLNWRTNLYYLETKDGGETWQAADGAALELPLTAVHNPALVHDYESEKLLVYIKDLTFGAAERPILVYETSRGFAPGPENGPRWLRTARWTGSQWEDRPIAVVDHNYDSAALYVEADGAWRVIAASEPGAQPHATGGDMAMWMSRDQGHSWLLLRQLTRDATRNHTFARRPVNAHEGFYSLWADGDAHGASDSSLYFATKAGNVFRLPRTMDGPTAKPDPMPAIERAAAPE